MRFRKLIASAVIGAAVAGGVAMAAPASAEGNTLADILNAQGGGTDGNWYDFDILAAGVDLAGLEDALDAPDANLTVFIPNDRAFQALVADLFGWKYWFANEATILGKVAELGAETLATVILYHAVPGQIDSSTALSVPKATKLDTVLGTTTPDVAGDFQITVNPIRWLGTAVLADLDPDDVNPTLVKSKLDIQASNGIAHGISFVLRPVNL